MAGSFVKWTGDRVERLKQLHAEGYSATQIAADLGLITRNAVIGKIFRLGLPKPEKWRGGTGHRRRAVPGGPGRGKKPYLRLAVLGHFDPKPKPLPKQRDEDIPLERRKQMLELQPWHCKYPIGNPGEPNFFFCGAAVFGRSYCVTHYHRCYTPTPLQISEAERHRRSFRAIRNIDRKKKGLVA